MIKAAIITSFCLLAALPSYSQDATKTATDEGIRRQYNTLLLRDKLKEADAALARNDLKNAERMYTEAWALVTSIGTGVDAEARHTQQGTAAARMPLAVDAQKRGDFRAADREVREVLRIDPSNQTAVIFKRGNDVELEKAFPHLPSPDVEAKVHEYALAYKTNATKIQDGRILYEAGKLTEAEAKLNEALREDPNSTSARYYLNLISNERFKRARSDKDVVGNQSLVDIEKDWVTPPNRDVLPVPNPYARSTLIHTSPGAQQIRKKLDAIYMDQIDWPNGLPLSEVIKILGDESRKRDPLRRGINFIINPNADVGGGGATGVPTAVDPTTGLPVTAAAPAEPVDVSATTIRLSLSDVRLADLLDAIVKVADKRIKYSIEDYAVVFSLKGPEAVPLFTKKIKVDPNTFQQGLESVVGFSIGANIGSAGGGGGATGGGGGGGAGGQNNVATAIPRVSPTSTIIGGQQGGGGGGGGGIGGQGGQGGGGGIRNVTTTNDQANVNALVRTFFTTMGVDLTPPKSIFFNDREGSLLIHAAQADIDLIETAVQALNAAPPMINIKTKFVEVTQNDAHALGFEYFLGNVLMNNGSMGLQGGTAPTFNGRPTAANPEGTFPGSILGGTALGPSTSDQLLSSGLRNQIGVRNPTLVPALGTFSGILTDPQFRVVLHALEQRDGIDLLDESSVTTLSGRQCQVQVVDLQTIVTGVSPTQTAAGGGGIAGGAGAVAGQINYPTSPLPVGPTLDVIPYVSADGFTIQMTIIPTIVEFLGYDDPGGFVPQVQSVGTGATGVPLTAQLPLPRIRLRQVTTSAIVWDGQTVVLGGLITEDVTKLKDKIPFLGDLPLLGRFFRSESSSSNKKNLMIFVTPTIIDPAGNRVHSEDEMPFANTVPTQRAAAAAFPLPPGQ